MFNSARQPAITLIMFAFVLFTYAPASAGGVKVDKEATFAPTGNTIAGPGIVEDLAPSTNQTIYVSAQVDQ